MVAQNQIQVREDESKTFCHHPGYLLIILELLMCFPTIGDSIVFRIGNPSSGLLTPLRLPEL